MTFADVSIFFSKLFTMFLLVLVSIALCGVAYAYFCLRRAGSTAFSLLHHVGAAVVLSLILSQYGVLLKADSLRISQKLLTYCVFAVCVLCLLYFVLVLYVCHRVQACFTQFLLIAVIVLLGSFTLLLEFGTLLSPFDSYFEPYSRYLSEYVSSLSPFYSS